MTQLISGPYPTTNPQIRPAFAPNLRGSGESGAGGFDQLFADKVRPEQGDQVDETTEANSDTEQAEETGKVDDAESAEQGEEDSEETGEGDRAAHGQSHPDTDADSGQQESARPTSETEQQAGEQQPKPGDQVRPIEVDPRDARPIVDQSQQSAGTIAESGAPVTEQEQVRRELKHAASVDLAAIARAEQLGPPRDGARPGILDDPQGRASAPTRVPPSPDVNAQGQQGSSGRPEGDLGKPTGFKAPEVTTDKAGTQTGVGSFPQGKSPGDPKNPITASNQARNPAPEIGSGRDAGARAESAAARAVFLDRLTNASAARRGAVSATERVVTVDRIGVSGSPRANTVRGLSTPTPPAQAHTPRDAFLAPVQKGLGRMLAEGGGKLSVMLRPQELGDVRISMETQRGAVRVKMEASSDAARRVLESGLDSLRATLEARGVRVETMDVTAPPRPEQNAPGDPRQGSSQNEGQSERHSDGQSGGQREPHSGQGSPNSNPGDSGRGSTGSSSDQTSTDQDHAGSDLERALWDRFGTELGIDAVA